MKTNRRYFVSYVYNGKFGNSSFGNTVFTSPGVGYDLAKELEKKDPELKGVVILFFTELKLWEFEEDVK